MTITIEIPQNFPCYDFSPATKKRAITPRRETRFPGLINAADALDVHRNHLYLVLSGKRQSKSLMKRYQALQKREQLSKDAK